MTKKLKIIIGISIGAAVSLAIIGVIVALLIPEKTQTFSIKDKNNFTSHNSFEWNYNNDKNEIPDGIFNKKSISLKGSLDFKYTTKATGNPDTDAKFIFNNNKIEIIGYPGFRHGLLNVASKDNQSVWIYIDFITILKSHSLALSCGPKIEPEKEEPNFYKSKIETLSLNFKY